MKIPTAYFFLLLYTLAMCKPVLPLVQDDLAHIFWKAKHLATVHHHHGDHHAQQEVAEAEYKETTDKQPARTKLAEPVSVHVINETTYNILQPVTHEQQFVINIYNVATVSVAKYYPPPKFC